MPTRTMSISCGASSRLRASAAGTLLLSAIVAPALALAEQRYTPPQSVARVRDARIREASGIVAGRRNPNCFYVHNDSGDAARVFAVDGSGDTLAVFELADVRAIDCEDIALAPGATAGVFDICLADIGDNSARRDELQIYRFPEPELTPAGDSPSSGPTARPAPALRVKPATFRLRYEDGPRNAEAFFVHPQTGDGYVLTKRADGTSAVYRLDAPWDAAAVNTLKRVAVVRFPGRALAGVVTAADISPDGRRIAIRTYQAGWELELPSPDTPFQAIFECEPTSIELANEGQGEALCYSADGQALFTISEGPRPDLYRSVGRRR